MPNVWFMNMDDEAFTVSFEDKRIVEKYTRFVNDRHLMSSVFDDIMVLPYSVNDGFVEYCERLGFINRKNIIVIKLIHGEGFFQSLAKDFDAQKKILEKCEGKVFYSQPYVQTSLAYSISERLGLQWEGCDYQVLENRSVQKVSSKKYIKEMAQSLEIPVIQFKTASDVKMLRESIWSFPVSNCEKLFLKKDGMTGGMGNVSGTKVQLIDLHSDWYSTGEVIIEPFVSFDFNIGAVLKISDEEIFLEMLTEQFFHKNKWIGFRSPVTISQDLVAIIVDYSFKIAKKLKEDGLRGWLNFDWGVPAEERSSFFQKGRVCLHECNFRYTAVYRTINFLRQYYCSKSKFIKILAFDEFFIDRRIESFSMLHSILQSIDHNGGSLLLDRDNLKSGVLISRPNFNGSCGLSIFGNSYEEISIILEKINKDLSITGDNYEKRIKENLYNIDCHSGCTGIYHWGV